MIRLPTQFDARARQHMETAAAGGSTSTCCSSCVVTLGATVVLSGMYFAHLRKLAKEQGQQGAADSDIQAEASPKPAANPFDARATSPRHATRKAAADTRNGQGSIWIWVTVSFVLLMFSAMVGDGMVALLTMPISLAMLYAWVKAHQRAGLSVGRAILMSFLSGTLLVAALVIEALAWMAAK